MPIRLATREDLSAINDIYNHYVLNSTATFQEEPSTNDERLAWFEAHCREYPVTVWISETPPHKVIAWASLSRFHPRSAYRHTVEDSIYVRNDMRGKGIGRALLADLINRAAALGHKQILALISADQPVSIELHRRVGFIQVGHLNRVGLKFNRWLDVVYMQRSL